MLHSLPPSSLWWPAICVPRRNTGSVVGRLALGAAVVALGAVPVTSPGIPILLSVVALAPAALVQARWKQPPSGDTDADAESGASL